MPHIAFDVPCSDLQGIRTTAKRDGSDWILNGSKTFITNGYMSDVVIVVAATDPGAKRMARGISLFLVDAGTPGFTKGRKLEKMGLKAQVYSLTKFTLFVFGNETISSAVQFLKNMYVFKSCQRTVY